jgi:UDP-N-acetyl-D-glucosamine dehydrogenase
VAWNRETIAGLDVTLIPTAHPALNCQELADWSPGIVDPRNALAGVKVDAEKVWKA